MRKLCLFPIMLLLIAVIGCNQKKPAQESVTDHLAQYRDTLVGNFCGSQIDTIICEPLDSISDPNYKGFHYRWRVFSKAGTVKDLLLDEIIGLHFTAEGDVDGNGTDEWGFVTEWEQSNWMAYRTYTYVDGEFKPFVEPTAIYLPHLDDPADNPDSPGLKREDIVKPSSTPGMVNVKFSDVRNDGEDFLVIDTIMPILNKASFINPYEECCKSSTGVSQHGISRNDILGKWLYNGRAIRIEMKLDKSGNYSVKREFVGEYAKDTKPEKFGGTFDFDSIHNRITLHDFYNTATHLDSVKYANPADNNLIVSYLNNYYMGIYSRGDNHFNFMRQ